MRFGRTEIKKQIQQLKGDENHVFKGTKIDGFLNWMKKSMIEDWQQHGKSAQRWVKLCDDLFYKASVHLFETKINKKGE